MERTALMSGVAGVSVVDGPHLGERLPLPERERSARAHARTRTRTRGGFALRLRLVVVAARFRCAPVLPRAVANWGGVRLVSHQVPHARAAHPAAGTVPCLAVIVFVLHPRMLVCRAFWRCLCGARAYKHTYSVVMLAYIHSYMCFVCVCACACIHCLGFAVRVIRSDLNVIGPVSPGGAGGRHIVRSLAIATRQRGRRGRRRCQRIERQR